MRLAFALSLLVLLCAAGTASAQDEFLYNYDGNVWEVGNFSELGSTAYAVGQVNDIAPFLVRGAGCTWTYYMRDLVSTSIDVNGDLVTVCYTGGVIEIHEDCVNAPPYCYGNTTPPNECAPSTFVDGDLILLGNLYNFCIEQNVSTHTGRFYADVVFNGGSQLENLPFHAGWTMGADFNSLAHDGYQHYAIGRTYINPATVTKPTTWGGIKTLYRTP